MKIAWGDSMVTVPEWLIALVVCCLVAGALGACD